jgi:anti-sigma regulatory factor (Ser/Thr protein kinase)
MIVALSDRSGVAEVRRLASDLASRQGLDATEVGRVSIVATELGTNLIKHAKDGEIIITVFDDSDGSGVELLAVDKGPGITDIQKSLADGHSTTGTAGSGLGSIQRNADVFGINSQTNRGTAVLARIRKKADHVTTGYLASVVNAPYPGEVVSGDGWAVKAVPHKVLALLADGSGHGQLAHAAAQRAIETFSERAGGSLVNVATSIHRALGATRGAAIAIAEIDPKERAVSFVGIGNISAALVDGGTVRRMASHNGTAGHVAPRIHVFQYPFKDMPTIIMHSDGLTGRWDLTEYPGLLSAHPSLISAVLYRDYRRGRDDASVVTVRSNAACQPAF